MSTLVDDIKTKAAQKKTRTIKIKVQLDSQTADELQFIIDNSKKLLGIDTSEYFAELLIEPKKKTISQLSSELKKEFEKSNKKDDENNQ